MTHSLESLATVDDLYRLPDDAFRYELVQGRLVSEPPPGGRHGRLCARLVGLLDRYLLENPGAVLLTCDPGFVLGHSPDTVRAPDIAVVSRLRYLELEDESKPIPGAPDLAIEILSPSDRASAIHAKVADFLAAGTRLVWVVDPDARQVRVYRNLLNPELLAFDDRVETKDVLPGFSVLVSEIFSRGVRPRA